MQKSKRVLFGVLTLVLVRLAVASEPPLIGNFYPTFYYIINEADYSSDQSVTIRDVDNKIIADVNALFKKDLEMEGSGILRSGETANFSKLVGSEPRFKIVKERWGQGVGNCPLKPYHTIAVDRRIIPFGTKVFIPAAKGAPLPDGTKHDGIFFAEDTGSRIQNFHIDLFAKEGPSSMYPYQKIGLKTGLSIGVYKLANPDTNGCFNRF